MELYLIRHAEAVPLGEGGITDDAQRPLTAAGEKQAQQVAAVLQKKGVQLDKVVTSPLLRARQTAEAILRDWKGPPPELHVTEDLAPDAKLRKLARSLRKVGGERLALVGHLPHLATWLAWLIGNKRVQIDLAKAGVAHVALGNGPRKGMGVLQWLVTPAWFE